MPTDNFSQGDGNTVIQARNIHGDVVLTGGRDESVPGGLPSSTAVFTGRVREIDALSAAVTASEASETTTIHTIDGMAGVGKTAFVLRASRLLRERFPDGLFFVHLYGHSPGRRPLEPGEALLSLLVGSGVAPKNIPEDTEARSSLWRRRTENKKTIVILDDASGSAQVRPLLPGEGGSLVLVTSRTRMSGLSGADPLTLSPLPTEEAVRLFTGLSRRSKPDETDDVRELVSLCGHLPLAVGIMAGRLAHRPVWRVRDLVDDLSSAKDLVRAIRTEDVSVTAALDLSFDVLSEDAKGFLLLLSLHPCAEFDVRSAAAAAGVDADTARDRLSDLYDRHLILETSRERYRFHDLVAEHLRAKTLSALPPESGQQTATRVLDHLLTTAHAADAILHGARAVPPPSGVVPPAASSAFDSSTRARSWLRAELTNLRTATRYAAENDLIDHALGLPRVLSFFLWQEDLLAIDRELHEIAVEAAERAEDELATGRALIALGRVRTSLGRLEEGDSDQRRALDIFEKLGEPRGATAALMQRGLNERLRGRLSRALDDLTRAREGYERLGDLRKAAKAINHIGVVHTRSGLFSEAVEIHEKALSIFRNLDDRLGIGITLNYLGIARLYVLEYRQAIREFEEARDIYSELGNHREFVKSVRNTGAAKLMIDQYPEAITELTWALQEYRKFGNRYGEANALHYLGSARGASGDFAGGAEDLSESASIFEELKSLSGQASALSKLGILREAAGDHSEAALILARTLELFSERVSPQREMDTRAALGSARAALGDRTGAFADLERALDLARRVGSRREESRILHRLGHVHLGIDDVPSARRAFDDALAIARELSLPLEESLAVEGLGQCLRDQGRTAEAREHLERALTYLSSIGSVHASRVETALAGLDGSGG
ncbi:MULTISPECIES: tetratricopeptide repeat protein [unclassified Nocardiopsis]|uniref:tetratricopeptide repeat protein n=1 Tax=Nocardiopsis TaxID=2013 RepID=UPI00387B1700